MKKLTAFQKLEAQIEKMIGQIIKYKGQEFEIRYDYKTYSNPKGFYVTAIGKGNVRKGDAQWLSYRAMKTALGIGVTK